MSARRYKIIFPVAILFLSILVPVAIHSDGGMARAWTDGNNGSPVRPNYGIQDMIAHKALELLNDRNSTKASYLTFWFDFEGADDEPVSFDEDNRFPKDDDNFLAWTDDGPEGVTVEYYINNPEPGQDPQTNAVEYAQNLANRSVDNLTEWLLLGGGSEDDLEIRYMHTGAYHAGKLAKYVGDMSQFGHTDYSKWDQLSAVPRFHLSEVDYPYREYYEARIWNDENMQTLYDEFWNSTFDPDEALAPDSVHTATSDLARWVNGRGEDPVQIQDYDGSTITVGYNYDIMLKNFMYCWDYDVRYNDVRGFNQTLWNLTMENLVEATEILSSIYEGIYDEAMERFLLRSPELNLINWSIEPEPAIDGDDVSVTATIRNDGLMRAENFRLLIEAPGGFSKWKGLTLDPGVEGNVTFPPFPVGSDPVDFTIRIDYEEKIAESDEDNNVIHGTVYPIDEIHSSEMSLAAPFLDIRRDTDKKVFLKLENTGNRADTFTLNAISDTEGLDVIVPGDGFLVGPYSTRNMAITLVNANDTALGTSLVDISATGMNSTANFDLSVQILERTGDPVPVVTGPSWARRGEIFTLSALDSTDPDGDDLTFEWIIPMMSNSTDPEITLNYTKLGLYEIELHVFDGNTSSSTIWELMIFPVPPENVSSEVTNRGVSGITVNWDQWSSGGLVAYWLEATAVEGQGVLSERGPYTVRVGPGNNSGRVGKFLPGTEVEIKVTVEAERFGNVTMDILTTTTSTTEAFEDSLELVVEDSYLELQYKPWIDPEGTEEPEIVVERLFSGSFVPLDTQMEYIQRTNTRHSLRYTLGSNSGTYRAYLTYFWKEETISPFDFFVDADKPNMIPDLNLSGADQEFRLNINGTCRVWFQLGILDPEDSMDISISWGDGGSEDMDYYLESSSREFISLFHNFTELGVYDVSVRVEDWNGAVSWLNRSVEVMEYKETRSGESEERSVWSLVLLILLGIVLVVILVALGFVAYKISKKDTEVEFKMKDFKSDIAHQKAGTGTDFDERRNLQIPQESIMSGPESTEDDDVKDKPEIGGTITFDDEE